MKAKILFLWLITIKLSIYKINILKLLKHPKIIIVKHLKLIYLVNLLLKIYYLLIIHFKLKITTGFNKTNLRKIAYYYLIMKLLLKMNSNNKTILIKLKTLLIL